jgi:hypothetical protein
MKKFLPLLRMDFLLAFRYGLLYAALFITLVYLGIFFPLSDMLQSLFLPFIIYIDLAIFGFYFLGAWIFFDRQENTLTALTITPITYKYYIWSKIIVLTLISVVISVFLSIALSLPHHLILLVISTTLNSILFCMIGLWIVVRFTSFSHFLPTSTILLFVFELPIFEYFHLFPSSPIGSVLWLFHPSFSSMKLIELSFDCCMFGRDLLPIIAYLGMTTIWIVVFQALAFKAFRKHILEA